MALRALDEHAKYVVPTLLHLPVLWWSEEDISRLGIEKTGCSSQSTLCRAYKHEEPQWLVIGTDCWSGIDAQVDANLAVPVRSLLLQNFSHEQLDS